MTEGKTAAPVAQDDQQPGIQVVTQYIHDLSFENPNAPESLVAGWGAPETSVQIDLRHRAVREGTYDCVLHFRIEAKKKGEDKTCFIADLSYGALVVLHNVPKENHQPILMIEVPKILFPFAREIIATATAQGGYPPLYLAPVNFEALYIAEVKRVQEEKGKAATN